MNTKNCHNHIRVLTQRSQTCTHHMARTTPSLYTSPLSEQTETEKGLTEYMCTSIPAHYSRAQCSNCTRPQSMSFLDSLTVSVQSG